MNRMSIVKLDSDYSNRLEDRYKTVLTYLRKDMIDSFMTRINKLAKTAPTSHAPSRHESSPQSRSQRTFDPKLVNNFIKAKVKPSIKNNMYIHELWGDEYYTRVLSQAKITQKLFADYEPQILEQCKNQKRNKKQQMRGIRSQPASQNISGQQDSTGNQQQRKLVLAVFDPPKDSKKVKAKNSIRNFDRANRTSQEANSTRKFQQVGESPDYHRKTWFTEIGNLGETKDQNSSLRPPIDQPQPKGRVSRKSTFFQSPGESSHRGSTTQHKEDDLVENEADVSSQLHKYETGLLKTQQVHNQKFKSEHCRLITMVKNNRQGQKSSVSFDEQKATNLLLRQCQSVQHFRESYKLGNKSLHNLRGMAQRSQEKRYLQTSQSCMRRRGYEKVRDKESVKSAQRIIDICNTEQNKSHELKQSIGAFRSFCQKFDKKLSKKSHHIASEILAQ